MTVSVSKFIRLNLGLKSKARLHLKEKGFDIFYARFGPRYINSKTYKFTFDIATIVVKPKLQRTGIFTNLVKRLRKQFPEVTLYVENASPILQKLLIRLGFLPHDTDPECFYLLGNETSSTF